MHKNFRPLLAALMVTTAQTALWATMPANAGVPGSRSQINLDAHSVALGARTRQTEERSRNWPTVKDKAL